MIFHSFVWKDDNASEISLTRKDLVLNEGKAVFNMINSIIGAGIIGEIIFC